MGVIIIAGIPAAILFSRQAKANKSVPVAEDLSTTLNAAAYALREMVKRGSVSGYGQGDHGGGVHEEMSLGDKICVWWVLVIGTGLFAAMGLA